jgi:hypothetical protein
MVMSGSCASTVGSMNHAAVFLDRRLRRDAIAVMLPATIVSAACPDTFAATTRAGEFMMPSICAAPLPLKTSSSVTYTSSSAKASIPIAAAAGPSSICSSLR